MEAQYVVPFPKLYILGSKRFGQYWYLIAIISLEFQVKLTSSQGFPVIFRKIIPQKSAFFA